MVVCRSRDKHKAVQHILPWKQWPNLFGCLCLWSRALLLSWCSDPSRYNHPSNLSLSALVSTLVDWYLHNVFVVCQSLFWPPQQWFVRQAVAKYILIDKDILIYPITHILHPIYVSKDEYWNLDVLTSFKDTNALFDLACTISNWNE